MNYTLEELKEEPPFRAEPAYRAGQVFSAINRRTAAGFEAMPGLSQKLARELGKRFVISTLSCAEHLVSPKDGTEKFLWKLKDGNHVETVLIKGKARKTLCLSAQVGCRFGCPFCASGSQGFIRDLETAEIVNQVLCVRRMKKFRITNVVFMGMGEPLDNYDNVEKAVRIINHPEGIDLGARKITISTCGIVPGIRRLSEIGLQIELSVSLHAANNELRDELVPVNREYPLEVLIPACQEFSRAMGRVVTLEYTVIRGKNDSLKDAEDLARIAGKLGAKVNLIALAEGMDPKTDRTGHKRMQAFRDRIRSKKVTVTVRKSKGKDILAACGQLAAEYRREAVSS